ncbi:TetR/AcrR family transcriptional regulator [Thioalkalivibrio sulfidiphilus]|uniref:TetR/AcrR family transcriptional regulator n=1 Tax=Thioalkalivibrio sulfidiphilus TaxID=1033854 RepID=UPI00039D25CC|nr:TetR/AcrR family transcriptional regulator [Thioalkalivibrio sulfidiphilus]
MSTKERKQREFAEREERFLAAAEACIREEGFLNLQMARIARLCDYATGTLYQHFSSKEDLLLALANRGNEAHVELFRQVQRWTAGSTRDRMFAIAVGDFDFAQRNPEHTKLLQYVHTRAVWESASPQRREQALTCTGPVGEIVTGIVREALEAGELEARGLSPMELACGPWSVCEGMQALSQVQGLFEALRIEDPERLRFRQVVNHLNGMGWQPLWDPADQAALEQLVSRIRTEVFTDL